MIIHLKPEITKSKSESLAKEHSSILLVQNGKKILITDSKIKTLPNDLIAFTEDHFIMESDIQLSSKDYIKEKVAINIDNIEIGGESQTTTIITGPCAVESEDQIFSSAEMVQSHGLKIIRAGCFKPRTSPYTFQGLGEAGLKILASVREKIGLKIITEIKDFTHADLVIDYTDIIQIGTKAMYDQGILRKCGESRKPVLLKRGFGTTLQEFVQAAEFIMCRGNDQVMLCERGIRTFETKTRFTLDLCGVAYLKEHTRLPVFVDPSHAMGYRYGVPDLCRASMAMGVDGLLIESHQIPEKALSDASQQLDFDEFEQMFLSLKPIASAVGRSIQ